MSQARIGRIRMKAGGAEVRVIRREAPNYNGENYEGKIIEHARNTAAYSTPGRELVGYFILGIYSDRTATTSWRNDPDRSPIPRKLLPAYVAELMRESMITGPKAVNEAVDVFNARGEPQ